MSPTHQNNLKIWFEQVLNFIYDPCITSQVLGFPSLARQILGFAHEPETTIWNTLLENKLQEKDVC